MGESVELIGHRLDQRRVPVAGVEHRNAACEVDVAAAFHVPHLGSFSAVGKDLKALAQPVGQGGTAAGHQGGVGEVGFALHGQSSKKDRSMPHCSAVGR